MNDEGKILKKVAGLWIDQEKAVIFSMGDEGAGLKRIASKARMGVLVTDAVHKESERASGAEDESRRLNDFYGEVISFIRSAESILIFGPGEVKYELNKRLEDLGLHDRVIGIEAALKMTDNAIIARIRQRFLK